MTVWECAVWGFFGAFAVDGLQFATAIRRHGGWPWLQPGEPGPIPILISVLIRLTVGAGLAAAAGATGQISGPFGAVAVGIAAPLLIEQIARQIPLTTELPDQPNAAHSMRQVDEADTSKANSRWGGNAS